MISTIELFAVVAILSGCGRELAMINNSIKNAAAKDHGWNAGDVQVGTVERLNRNGCSFFRATNSAQMGRQPAEYAVLPDGKVVGSAGAARVLKECGKDAPAEWWAQVITRFSGKVSGIVVDPKNAPSALRKIREAGGEYSPPKLVTERGSTSVTFYTIQYEEGLPYEVKAALTSTGTLAVDSKKLLPKPRLVK
jgi:hypothetical protein